MPDRKSMSGKEMSIQGNLISIFTNF